MTPREVTDQVLSIMGIKRSTMVLYSILTEHQVKHLLADGTSADDILSVIRWAAALFTAGDKSPRIGDPAFLLQESIFHVVLTAIREEPTMGDTEFVAMMGRMMGTSKSKRKRAALSDGGIKLRPGPPTVVNDDGEAIG